MSAQRKAKKKSIASLRHHARAKPGARAKLAKRPAQSKTELKPRSKSQTRPSDRTRVRRQDDVRMYRRAVDDHAPSPGAPGSIEQQLDMVENGNLRGDEVTFSHGNVDGPDVPRPKDFAEGMRSLDRISETYNVDMSEENREGDEMSGNDHSSGLQGDDAELSFSKPHIRSGMPGDESLEDEEIVDETERHRMPMPGEEEGNEEDT